MLCGLDGQYFVDALPQMHHQRLMEGIGGWGEAIAGFARGVYGVA
jgi:hypothetical protein